MNQKIHFPFFFSYCVKKYSSFGVGEGLKQGRSGYRKQTYIFGGSYMYTRANKKSVFIYMLKKIMIGPKLFYMWCRMDATGRMHFYHQ